MYVGLKQLRGDGERYVTPARAAAKETNYPPISDLIHLARCVKFNPQFNPWIVLIGLRGTEFNRRINLLRGF